jgi:hypothetical protein
LEKTSKKDSIPDKEKTATLKSLPDEEWFKYHCEQPNQLILVFQKCPYFSQSSSA